MGVEGQELRGIKKKNSTQIFHKDKKQRQKLFMAAYQVMSDGENPESSCRACR